jgi:hypothetical protein
MTTSERDLSLIQEAIDRLRGDTDALTNRIREAERRLDRIEAWIKAPL